MTNALTGNIFSQAKIHDQLAASTWLLDIVESLTGVDVLAELVTPIVGQWGTVNAYGQALASVAQCVESVSDEVAAISRDLDESWHGMAADDGRIHLASVVALLRKDSRAQAHLGVRYQELATAIQCGQVAAEMILKAVLDTAVEIALWAAAGAATPPTRAGSVFGYAMATYKTISLTALLHDWALLVAAARAETNVFLGERRTTDGKGDQRRSRATVQKRD